MKPFRRLKTAGTSTGWGTCPRAIIVAAGLVASSGTCFAEFFESFENGTVGSPPAGWSITGTNGSTATANIASDGGNQFIADSGRDPRFD